MCFETVKDVEHFKGNARITQRAINKYYSNPKYCKECGHLIKLKCGQRPGQIKDKIFCSHSCSASFNNRGDRKHGEMPIRICSGCGGFKDYKAERCIRCRGLECFIKQEQRTLESIALKGNARVKWAALRALGNKKLKLNNIEKKCVICGFDHFVDSCHIKPINSFPLTALVSEVNSLKNLVYLCPNHHEMLDRGLLNEENLKLIELRVISE